MFKNTNLIKKVKVLSYNELNKKFDAQSVIISNIADATDEYDAINFSSLKKYINNNIENKIFALSEELKELKKNVYNTDEKKEKYFKELSEEEELKKIKQNIFEYNINYKEIIDKFLYYEKKNEYIFSYIENLDTNYNILQNKLLEKEIYENDKKSLKKIFFSLEENFKNEIKSMVLKYENVNILFSNLQKITEELNYKELNLKIKNLDYIPDLLKSINITLNSLLEYKKEVNEKIETISTNINFDKKTIEENFEELNIFKNILKEFENKILLFDIKIIENKKDIDFLKENFKILPESEKKEINYENKKIHDIEKKILIIEKLFSEERQINNKNFFKYIEDKKKINEDLDLLKNSKENINEYLSLYKNENDEKIKILEENFTFLFDEKIKKISEIQKKNINDDSENNINDKIENIKKDYKFLTEKIKKHIDINKIDINLINSVINTLKEDIIKINKIILDNNSFKEINYTNIKEFMYDIPITISNNNFNIPSNLNSFFSFSQKVFNIKFIKFKLIKLYVKIDLKNSHNISIPVSTVYNKENLKFKFIKNNKDIFNFEVSNLEETSIEVKENIFLTFPLNLIIKNNNLKEAINLDYYFKRNNLKTLNIKILGIFGNYFE